LSALVKETTGDPPTTFSIGFESMEHDELAFANRMATALGGRQHTVVCNRATADSYPHVLWHMELPLQFPLALPLQRLSACARSEGFKVVLTGEGADELFGGYDCFRADKMRRIFDRPLLRPLRPAAYRRLYAWHGLPEGTVDKMLANQSRSAEIERRFGGVYPAWFDMWTTLDLDRARLLSPDGRRARPADEPPEGFADLLPEDVASLHPFDAVLALELESRLPSWILQIGDRASIANGVEARVPFLDHEVVEFAASLSPALKMQGFTEKALLRGAMRDLLPPEIARRQKRPFYTPLKSWFFAKDGPAYVPEVLGERAVRDAGLFDPGIVTRLRRDLHDVPDDHLLRVQHEWVLTLVLGTQLLHELFVSERGGAPAAEGPWI
jgi:asparagine synthase (glutamine-hydrolysing)